MSREKALARGKGYLDEATENLTFDEFAWAFEEVWHGVGWLLNSLLDKPLEDVGTGEKGAMPEAGSLKRLYEMVENPPEVAKIVFRLEKLRRRIRGMDEVGEEEVVALVFKAWELHNQCGLRCEIVDERLGERKLLLAEASPGRVGSRVMERRTALKILAAGSLFPVLACRKIEQDNRSGREEAPRGEDESGVAGEAEESPWAKIQGITRINSMHWPTTDPFLFCAHHNDHYPAGNGELGPAVSLAGRHLGRDFDEGQRWRMYHGRRVPGFPRHPHRGFETVTVVRTGFLDHADSLGATARYGGGDVQWLTAGGGIQHAEMFPLLRSDGGNPLELFQIWLNLPRADKMVDPYFTMLWAEQIPRVTEADEEGRLVELTIAAGSYKGHRLPAPPPNSWAAKEESDIAIWSIRLEPEASFVLPEVQPGTVRSLYVHVGAGIEVAGQKVENYHRVMIEDAGKVQLRGGHLEAEVLLLQGRPINEPVAQRGPFVMNTQEGIQQAYADYRRTHFGGWPWRGDDPVHEGDKGRFARHADGRYEEPI